ncbi:MAG: amino acid adenylation domain-containing protein, partial [Candidatus Aminicenantes bacterium]|nr:amino acid adenylation domain-containing protein [Candidatus Aminicenantes bacterium]
IAKEFEKQAGKTPGAIALKAGELSLSYGELNRIANRVAHLVLKTLQHDQTSERVSLLLDHGTHMIAAILGVLKAGQVYVPLSIDYPDNRLSYMIENSESSLVLTLSRHMERARRLVGSGVPCLSIDRDLDCFAEADENPGVEVPGDRLAYIMYTSGSTGRPKGVKQTHENVLYYIENWTRIFSIIAADNMTLFSSFCHDASVPDIYSALLNGATLFPVNIRDREGAYELSDFLILEKITIWHSVHSLFAYFANSLTGNENFAGLRWILLGGEPIRQHEILCFKKFFPHSLLANIYGQTESSVNSIWVIHPRDTVKYLIIGEPLEGTQIFIIDENETEVDQYEIGEIVIASPHVSPGYWNDEAATEKVFGSDDEYGVLYFTGDLGRLLPDGMIEFVGRRDSQVKLRGFRIELGEIESHLLRHPDISEAVVAVREFPAVTAEPGSRGDQYLCAYIVAKDRKKSFDITALKAFLLEELPDYMIPTFFVTLERLPLTQSGKIDRKVLPDPEIGVKERYVAPRNHVEEKLVEIWQSVLGVEKEKIGIDSDFFELGGHSLRGTTVLSKVHKAFNVRIPVAQIFQLSTIRGLAAYINEAVEDRYIPIEPAVPKDFYQASAIQKRLFILSKLEGIDTAYNMKSIMQVEGKLEYRRLERAVKKIIDRHESLRTSFELKENEMVQIIHNPADVEFKMEYYELDKIQQTIGNPVTSIIKNFVRPFDLSKAPLLRVGLIKIEEEKHIFTRDTHHIISDGTSQTIFLRELLSFYEGKELPGLKIQYKDFVEWQAGQQQQDSLKKQEEYWLQLFKDGIPEVENFTDYPRSPVQSFAGDFITMQFDEKLTRKVNEIARAAGATLYMILLAVYNILLFKYTGQEDIVIGTPTAGRDHPALENIIGLFINVLAMRNYPSGGKTFVQFLNEVRANTTSAYENQGYSFGHLVEKLGVTNDISRNPIYDMELVVQNMDFPSLKTKEISFSAYPYEVNVSQVDAALYVVEFEKNIYFRLIYSTSLFKRVTMERFIAHFLEIVSIVVENKDIKLRDIELCHDLEKVKADVYQKMADELDF